MLHFRSIWNVRLSVWRKYRLQFIKLSLTRVHLVDWKQERREPGTQAWTPGKSNLGGSNCW
jgi:hypothetical protein